MSEVFYKENEMSKWTDFLKSDFYTSIDKILDSYHQIYFIITTQN